MTLDITYNTDLLKTGDVTAAQSSPLVAIVILNWNGWQDTTNCLSSLNVSEYKNFRIIIVDNGSTDDSVDHLQAVHADFTIIETGVNLGFAGGCNVGIRYAFEISADYIWLLNNDTVVEQQSLSALVTTAGNNRLAGAVGSVLYEMERPTVIQAWGGGGVNLHTGKSYHVKGQNGILTYLTGASLLLRAEALRQTGLLDEGFFVYWEDTDLSFRLSANGWRLLVEPSSRVWHRECSSTGRFSRSRARLFYRSRVRFLQKYASYPLPATFYGLIDQSARDIYRMRWGHLLGAWQGTMLGLVNFNGNNT